MEHVRTLQKIFQMSNILVIVKNSITILIVNIFSHLSFDIVTGFLSILVSIIIGYKTILEIIKLKKKK